MTVLACYAKGIHMKCQVCNVISFLTQSSNNFMDWAIFLTFALQKQPPEVFNEKGVLQNFVEFTGKHLCQSLFFNKNEGNTGT